MYSSPLLVFALACSAAAAVSLIGCAPPPARVDTSPLPEGRATSVVIDARIFTAMEERPFAEAMAIRDGRLLYVGDEAGLEPFLDPRTVRHDLGGRVVLPGLHDVHQHTLEAHLAVVDCIVDGREEDPEAYVRPVSRCRPTAGTGWVLGWGHSILTLLDAERPPREILDEAHPDTPVAIMEETSHSTWVNSAALDRLGIDAATPDPQGGVILRDSAGRPTGILIDAAGEWPWDLALAANDRLSAANEAALRDAVAHNNEMGITSAVDARVYLDRGYLDAYDRVAASGDLSVRMVLALWASPVADDDAQIARIAASFRDDGGRVRVRQVKLYSDGLIENTTAALLEDYATSELFAGVRGLSYFPPERMERYVIELQAVGFDAHIHAIGDRAVRESLDVVEAARAAPSGSQALHRLTHVELTHPNDVARFAASGAAADLQLGAHTDPAELPVLEPFVGRDRLDERAWVLRDLWETGAVIALSSDYDVAELSPFAGMARALDRGEQSLPDVAAAVRAYTINGARIMRSEADTGSLVAGKYADFVIVDRDIFSVAPAEIAATRVLATVVEGEWVYRRNGARF